ncbi:hypothetical protein A3G55_03350 [Candidatus Giovannonibacteria bacterium RIFCSPLOWO2_12_FULL_44_25]|uniref:GtrA/DPMS transmembrane domain-containing protein n=2 Tax=Candidatus Giovannoniibacteriota TaxID=1752738 RepID=A0A1F5W7N2_9BACT|nr:MAG: hypothetical protein UW15_C0003G0041 [Parcubacteria group bacterium GW2011_GWC1_44_10]KKT60057.1 MAG: hypothetical protein UW53_C0004G0069 [Candidatus Giovannonibacteria bacterium GW2011_GWA1_44_25]KKU30175.1 MAG: hypothetical protein UX43_C0002G0069 [Candidatus Giovannonibacteria bacterium GW2011_GWB1_46_20]OGF49759.1 MAG: hypothetical protein A2120_00420 [Candidatus Giovannonibacteria bacterium GWA2_45_15]OGF59468.1 MAG: hypothetical protein A2W40_03535 [Candidatus Giovannonibacteria 
MITKKDYWIGAVVGFFTGLLALVMAFYLEISFPYKEAAFLVGVPVFFAFGVWLGGFLGRYYPFFEQFGKYVTAGFLSTLIDFTTLNVVSNLTGITAGIVVGWVNMPGFIIAVFNGYLWNKLWVFTTLKASPAAGGTASLAARASNGLFSDFPKFLAITVGGLILNTVSIIIITTYIPAPAYFTPGRWLNLAKVLASILVIIWNFTGFKFIVFRKYAAK